MRISLTSLHSYPIKSCAGTSWPRAVVTSGGLPWDRQWLLVDESGQFMTQRTYPSMACIQPTIESDVMRVSSPRHPDLIVPLAYEAAAPIERVGVWRAQVAAYRLNDEIAQWFSAVVGRPCALYRAAEPFDRQPEAAPLQAWRAAHGDAGASHGFAFADGFPLLVLSLASLQALNERLVAAGHAPVTMDRFRPNIVVDGIEAFDEDHIASMTFGPVTLGLVKPCKRCRLPDVDQTTGALGVQPGLMLAQFRAFEEGIMFGQNAIVTAGAQTELAVGDKGEYVFSF